MFIKRQNEKRARDGAGQGKRAPLIPCALNQPIALLCLFLSRTHITSLSPSVSFFSRSQWQPLHLRSVLIFGGALIYQRVYPSTIPTPDLSFSPFTHDIHTHTHTRARAHPESNSALTRPASKFIKESFLFSLQFRDSSDRVIRKMS